MNRPDSEGPEFNTGVEGDVAPHDADSATPDDSPPADAGGTADNRPPRRAALLTVLMLSLGVIALNWPYRYTVATSIGLGSMTTPVDFSLADVDPPRLGGWPYRYLVSYEATETQSAYRVLAPRALLYNIALALLPIGLAAYYIFRRTRRIAAGRLSGKRITIADLLAITLLLAVPLGLWQRLSAVSDSELAFAEQVQRQGGAVQLQAWVPSWLASRLPDAFTNKLKKIRAVRLESAGEQLLAEIVKQRGLTTLRLGGADYDLRLLDQLVSNPLIGDLRIAGRVIDATTLQAIAAHPRLHTLNLMRTNVSAKSLTLLNGLTGLQRLSLIHADVLLSELASPKWSRTIRELRLPHPEPGQSDSLQINGWPQLASLEINELDTQTNSSVMRVTLADLPKLAYLGLDIFQKFDLTLRNLPQLEKISELEYEWRSRIPRKGAVPGYIWYAGLDLEDLPIMGDLDLFAVDLEKFRIVGAPKIQTLGVGAFYHTVSQQPYARDLTPQVAEALINGLGQSEGPFCVDLDAVPLKGVDLSPLKKNTGLKQLMLSQSQTTLEQWKGLEGMTWLTRLDIKECPIDNDGIQWILNSFPALEHFAFSPLADEVYAGEPLALKIIDRPDLSVLDLGNTPTQWFNQVRIINSPQVSIDLQLGFVSELEIRGSPGIQGLAVNSTLPADTTLRDFRDLKYFAVGGPEVTDKMVEAIADCQQLATLTLAYPSITAEAFKKLTNIGSVSSLHLPGSAVDDGIVAGWPAFTYLTKLDLSDTKITSAALPKLLASGQGRRIRLDRTAVAQDDLRILTEQHHLQQLSLAGVGIDAPTLKSVLEHRTLQQLDLSDAELDSKIFAELLANGSSLQYLMLRNCTVDSDQIEALARKQPSLVFDLTGSNASTRILTGLLSSGRMVDTDQWQQRQMMQQMISSASAGNTNMTVVQPELPALIQVENFRPRATGTRANSQVGGAQPTVPPSGLQTLLREVFSPSGGAAAATEPMDDSSTEGDRGQPGDAQAIESGDEE